MEVSLRRREALWFSLVLSGSSVVEAWKVYDGVIDSKRNKKNYFFIS